MHYVEEIFELVGTASTCWDEDGTFKTSDAIKVADRLCEIVREQRQEAVDSLNLLTSLVRDGRAPRRKRV